MKNKAIIKVPVSCRGKLKSAKENNFTLNFARENVSAKAKSVTVKVSVK